MYGTEIFTPDKETKKQTITTLEIAEMMEVEHSKIIRKLEGGKDRKGFIQILTEAQMGVSDYFIPSAYRDASGKENKCYKVTKLGCDFLANKFNGEKGIIFTARYVKRFDEMEDCILQKNIQKPSITEATEAAKLIRSVYQDAGVDPRYIAVSVNGIYKEVGLNLPLPIEMKEDKLYDQTALARELGIMSVAGKPHSQAVGTIIDMLDVSEKDKVCTPYTNHGHSGVVIQYTANVLTMIRDWLKDNGYPAYIKGSNKSFKVCYS